jgi:glyoxylase-like metal-dependent hydrolase (beta-lactamase superfamily II)
VNGTRFGRRKLLLTATALVAAGPVGRASAAPARTASWRSAGGFEIRPLVDASGPFFLGREDAFPGATAEDWDRARRADPSAFGTGDEWLLDFRCFLVRGPRGRLMLVDTGVGPADSPAAAWAPVPGRLPAELERAGIDPRDVDTVVLTHLHEDHYGWAVLPGGTPLFPNARYVVQHREVAALPDGDIALSYTVDPLRATGQLHEVSGAACLATAPGRGGGSIRVVPTPGHTPGHQSVIVDGRHEQVVVTGDVLVHAVQLVDPSVGYAFESDPDTARRTRTTVLREARARGAVIATAHLRRPFIDLR